MPPAPVPAAATATPLVTDPTPRVVLLCSPSHRESTRETADALTGPGREVVVLTGSLVELVEAVCAELTDAGYALLVPCSPDADTPVLRSRVRRSTRAGHHWIDGAQGVDALRREVDAHIDALAPEPTPRPASPVADVLPFPEPPARRAQRKPSKARLVLWPVVGATLTAFAVAAIHRSPASPPPTVQRVVAPVPAAPPAAPPRAETPSFATPPPPPPRAASSVSPPPAQTHVDAALSHERITATDDVLVFAAGDRPRDWFAAMDVCRGRTHAGLQGWTTPSSRQLHALAKARVLPEAALWSRTRSARAVDTAFVVHGRAGTTRGVLKTETLGQAVCVRPRKEP